MTAGDPTNDDEPVPIWGQIMTAHHLAYVQLADRVEAAGSTREHVAMLRYLSHGGTRARAKHTTSPWMLIATLLCAHACVWATLLWLDDQT